MVFFKDEIEQYQLAFLNNVCALLDTEKGMGS